MLLISLFNGLSIAQLALTNANLPLTLTLTSEIEPSSLKHESQKYPNNIKLGDVQNINGFALKSYFNSVYKGVPIIFTGGSPCQRLSFAGARDGIQTECNIRIETLSQYLELKKEGFKFKGQSYLFWEWVRLREEIAPDYWLLENVNMAKTDRDTFNKAVGCNPVMIDSALVSGQRRKRNYWCNWDLELPQDRGILFKDINDRTIPFKAMGKWVNTLWSGRTQLSKLSTINDNKSPTLTTSRTHSHLYILNEDRTLYRNLSVREFLQLQTLPLDWVDGFKQTHAVKMIGNGWTLDVIVEIFKQMPVPDTLERNIERDCSINEWDFTIE